MLLGLRVDSHLKLSSIEWISFGKVGSGKECWSIHFTICHILDSSGKIVLVALILLQKSVYIYSRFVCMEVSTYWAIGSIVKDIV